MIPGALTGLSFGRAEATGSLSRLQAETSDWLSRVKSNVGTVSGSTLVAVDVFVRGCKSDAVWSLLSRVNLFCGDQLAACLVPLMVGAGNAVEANTGFVGADYTESTGLAGNGTSKYLNSGLLGTAFSVTDRHLSVYESARATGTLQTSIGHDTAANTNAWLLGKDDGATRYTYTCGSNRTRVLTVVSTGAHYIGSSVGSVATLFQNGSSVASGTATGVAQSLALYLFADNRSGTTTNFSPARLSGYTIGLGLTATQALALYTRIQAFQTALGRQV